MEKANNMKALYIIVNAGFADEVMEIARGAGAKGATIINARGTGACINRFWVLQLIPKKR